MARVTTRVNLDDAAFLRLNYPGGPIGGFMNGFARSATTLARYRAPGRTNRLRRSIDHEVVQRNLRGVQVRISADVAYAAYVHNGTRIIWAGPKGLVLYAGNGPYGDRHADAAAAHPSRVPWIGAKYGVVNGQAAQPFLWSAARDTKRMLVH